MLSINRLVHKATCRLNRFLFSSNWPLQLDSVISKTFKSSFSNKIRVFFLGRVLSIRIEFLPLPRLTRIPRWRIWLPSFSPFNAVNSITYVSFLKCCIDFDKKWFNIIAHLRQFAHSYRRIDVGGFPFFHLRKLREKNCKRSLEKGRIT